MITRLAVLERLDRSEQDYRQNGGIPSEHVKTHIDELKFIAHTELGLKDVEAGRAHAAEDVFAELSIR